MSEIAAGAPAPGFRLQARTRSGNREITLSDFAGKEAVVLYFYPKDDTPGCTKEACAFRDLVGQFEAAGAAIVGISPDTVESHEEFADKFGLPFPLLADPDHKIADTYGVWKEKMNYGKTYWGIERTTFVIDRSGKVAKVYPRVKVEDHADKVLEFVRGLG
jgi:thioredoxin-dependent peroxiredoxin